MLGCNAKFQDLFLFFFFFSVGAERLSLTREYCRGTTKKEGDRSTLGAVGVITLGCTILSNSRQGWWFGRCGSLQHWIAPVAMSQIDDLDAGQELAMASAPPDVGSHGGLRYHQQ